MQKINFEGIMRRNVGKGEPIGKIGATGSGKTTLDEVLAKSQETQTLLEIREAEGKGSLITTEVIATDDEAIPEQGLLAQGVMKRKVVADVTDDNDLFGNILYAATKELVQGNKDKYETKLRETLEYHFGHPANDSLAYRIRGMAEEKKQELLELLLSFDKSVLESNYNEMLAKNPKKGQKGKLIFIGLMSEEPANQELIQKLWELVVDVVNADVEGFKEELIGKQEEAWVSDDGITITFMVYITTKEEDEKFRSFILKSEYGSKEYLFDSLTLLFRGREVLFSNEYRDCMSVGEVEGRSIHQIRLIDTQGILHPLGATVDSEVERVIDILSVYHCRHIILVCNAYVNNTRKDADTVIEKLLQNCKAEIKIHVLFTHLDEKLSSENIQGASTGKFARRNAKVNWNAIYEKVVQEQKEQLEGFKEFLELNDGKRKPVFKGMYHAGLYTDINALDDLLEQEGLTYDCAMERILEAIHAEVQKDGDKIKVAYKNNAYYENLFSSNDVIMVESLFRNLVACKGKKLYASTVRACYNHWKDFGDMHSSNVLEPNPNDYENIKTEFVREMRNIPRNVMKDIAMDKLAAVVCNETEQDKFTKLVKEAFREGLGRHLARIIGQDSYEKGFRYEEAFYKPQYVRFEQMLIYVQSNYFNAAKVQVNSSLAAAMNAAIAKCITEVISAKCIVVY